MKSTRLHESDAMSRSSPKEDHCQLEKLSIIIMRLFDGKLLPAETKYIVSIVDIVFKNLKLSFVDVLTLLLETFK